MEPTASCLFGLGLPQPMQCRLPEGHGGAGSTRQCISDRGVIEQTISVWDEPHHLVFRMDRTDLYFRSWVPSIADDFELASTPDGGTRATRTTSVTVIADSWASSVLSAEEIQLRAATGSDSTSAPASDLRVRDG